MRIPQAALDIAAACVGSKSDSSKYALEHIEIRQGVESYTILATDGSQLMRVEVPIVDKSFPDWSQAVGVGPSVTVIVDHNRLAGILNHLIAAADGEDDGDDHKDYALKLTVPLEGKSAIKLETTVRGMTAEAYLMPMTDNAYPSA